MDYPNKTLTLDGQDLLATTNGTSNGVVIDKAIISDQLPQSNKSLESMTLNDIPDATVKKIDTVKHQQNTVQPEITLHNTGMTNNYTINTIGLLAHAGNDNSGNEILYVIATANNDPFIMPRQTGTKFDFSIALPMAFSNTGNVTIISSEAGMVTNEELKHYQSEFDSNISSNIANISNVNDTANANSANIITLSESANTNHNNDSTSISQIQDDLATNHDDISNLSKNTTSNAVISSMQKNIFINSLYTSNLASSANSGITFNSSYLGSVSGSAAAKYNDLQYSLSNCSAELSGVSNEADNNVKMSQNIMTRINNIKQNSSGDLTCKWVSQMDINSQTPTGFYYYYGNSNSNKDITICGYPFFTNSNIQIQMASISIFKSNRGLKLMNIDMSAINTNEDISKSFKIISQVSMDFYVVNDDGNVDLDDGDTLNF